MAMKIGMMRTAGMAVLALLLMATTTWAGVTNEQLAIVKGLKRKGLVGEDNRGFLAYVTEQQVAVEVVDAVNAERLKAYQKIAREQQVEVAQVGRSRAGQLAAEAAAGEWIQEANGKWRKKPGN